MSQYQYNIPALVRRTIWGGVHRRDLNPFNECHWRGFDMLTFGGWGTSDEIIRRFPHLGIRTGVYLYPYLVRARTLNQSCSHSWPLENLHWGGHLLDSYPHVSQLTTYGLNEPTQTRCGYWIDWRDVNLNLVVDRFCRGLSGANPIVIPHHVSFWRFDLIRELYTLFWNTSAAPPNNQPNPNEYPRQVQILVNLVKNILNIPVAGNIYSGQFGGFAGALQHLDILSFELWRWYWENGTPVQMQPGHDEATLNRIQSTVEQSLSIPNKKVILHVPAMPPQYVQDAINWIYYMVDRYGVDRVYFYEFRPKRNDGVVRISVRRLIKGIEPYEIQQSATNQIDNDYTGCGP